MLEIYHKREVFIIKIILASLSILVTIVVVTKIESVGKDLNFRVYILAIAAFVVGTVELIIGGTLDLVANDLGVSISAAGQLITIFSVVFALSGPVLLAVTGSLKENIVCWSIIDFLNRKYYFRV